MRGREGRVEQIKRGKTLHYGDERTTTSIHLHKKIEVLKMYVEKITHCKLPTLLRFSTYKVIHTATLPHWGTLIGFF